MTRRPIISDKGLIIYMIIYITEPKFHNKLGSMKGIKLINVLLTFRVGPAIFSDSLLR